MKTVNISDLKARLSAHIQAVRDGEEVLVCDRNQPVARIVPCQLEDRSEQERRLVARGVLTTAAREAAHDRWLEFAREAREQVRQEEREDR